MLNEYKKSSYTYLLLCAFFLVMLGSNISVIPAIPKIRPFHIGSFLFFIYFTMKFIKSPHSDVFLFTKNYRKIALIVTSFIYLLIPTLWIVDLNRFITFWIYILFGSISFLIGTSTDFSKRQLNYICAILVGTWLIIILTCTYFGVAINGYPAPGGAYGNINDMSLAFTTILLLHYLTNRKASYWLFGICLAYAVLLDRRIALIALTLFAILDISINNKSQTSIVKKISIYGIILLASFGILKGHTRGFSTSRYEAPTISSEIKYNTGDYMRIHLLQQMKQVALSSSWYQTIIGHGPGQLNLTMLSQFGDQKPWASPHFFPLEMYFYFGLGWIAFIIYIFLKVDRIGRVAMIVLFTAGLAPSSLIYFMPFYVLLGKIYVSNPKISLSS